jgi:hypothetical protein
MSVVHIVPVNPELKEVCGELNGLVRRLSGESESALAGLEALARAFGILVNAYALPNEENAEGMCDDPAALRHHIASYLTDVLTEREVSQKGGTA